MGKIDPITPEVKIPGVVRIHLVGTIDAEEPTI